jgi:hypothetical protein
VRDSLRLTEQPVEIFQMVLRSLETHRPAKAEHELLDEIRERYLLSGNAKLWPSELIKKRISVDEFLKFVLDRLSPFVDMILEIYDFLHAYASTSGGKTQHFAIESEDLSKPWSFDVSKLPKQIRWIQGWMDMRVEEIVVHWETISDCLIIDNGIFYGTVEKKRLIQSLIIARRNGSISLDLLSFGDQIYETIKRAARAWYHGMANEIRNAGRDHVEGLQLRIYLPSIDADFLDTRKVTSGNERRGYVAIDLECALENERGSYAAADVFLATGSGLEVGELLPALDRNWSVQAAVFFCALWGLEEHSFQRIAGLLTNHESRGDLLQAADLDRHGAQLGKLVIERLAGAITPTGEMTHAREFGKRRLEILLLPYWKDRWFLFEVWTLIQVLRQGKRIGADVKLQDIHTVADPNILGAAWHLPTQKATKPVAVLSSAENVLLVWFQRETRRTDSAKNMEPDIRLTTAAVPDVDVAIVECKDRIKFAGAKSDAVVESYLTGSLARLVWLVNYENDSRERSRTGRHDGQSFGIVNGFRPHAISVDFSMSLDAIIREHLKLERDDPSLSPDVSFLIIDASGSMDGKVLPDSEIVRNSLSKGHGFVKLWTGSVADVDAQKWRELSGSRARINGADAEDGRALESFARSLAEGAKLTVITDASGRDHLLTHGAADNPNSSDQRYLYTIGGKPLDIIVIV